MGRRRRFGPRWPSWLRWSPLRGGICCHWHSVGIGVKASLFPPMPSSSVSFLGENLDHVGQTTTASFASLPPWRRYLGDSCRWWSMALLGEDTLLRLPSLSLLCVIQVALVVCWQMLCCYAALADALPPCRWLSSLRMDALPSLLVGRVHALPP